MDPATLLAAIRAPVREDLAAVDHAIRTELASDVVLVNSIAEYIIGAGGKRLRPLLVVLAARAAGYTGQSHASAAGVAGTGKVTERPRATCICSCSAANSV